MEIPQATWDFSRAASRNNLHIKYGSLKLVAAISPGSARHSENRFEHLDCLGQPLSQSKLNPKLEKLRSHFSQNGNCTQLLPVPGCGAQKLHRPRMPLKKHLLHRFSVSYFSKMIEGAF
jgi:hypothetical protein